MKHDPLVTHLRDMCDRGAYQAACMAADPAAILTDRNRLAEENERLRALLEKLATYDKRLHWETIEEIKAALSGREEDSK